MGDEQNWEEDIIFSDPQTDDPIIQDDPIIPKTDDPIIQDENLENNQDTNISKSSTKALVDTNNQDARYIPSFSLGIEVSEPEIKNTTEENQNAFVTTTTTKEKEHRGQKSRSL